MKAVIVSVLMFIAGIFLAACGDTSVPTDPGLVGPIGPQGPDGPAGPSGPQGLNGASGAIGPQGPQGPQGSTGPTGPAGAQGDQGPQGLTGPTGPTGATGATGPQGPAGHSAGTTILFNPSGTMLGRPIMIDIAEGGVTSFDHVELAIFASGNDIPGPIPGYPSGYIVAGTPRYLWYLAASCAGTAYIEASSRKFEPTQVLYPAVGMGTTLYRASSAPAVRTAVSRRSPAGACTSTGGSFSAVSVTPTTFNLDMSTPWTVDTLP